MTPEGFRLQGGGRWNLFGEGFNLGLIFQMGVQGREWEWNILEQFSQWGECYMSWAQYYCHRALPQLMGIPVCLH